MGSAASILVGMRIGAGKIEEARLMRGGSSDIFLFSLISTAGDDCANSLVTAVYQFEPATTTLLVSIMIIHALSLPFVFYSSNVIFITRAGGYTKSAIWITNVPYLLIKIPLIVLFVFISRSLFEQSVFLHSMMERIGLGTSLVIFIFPD